MSHLIQAFDIAAPQWPTVDPFLFVAHHLDAYPAADGQTQGPPRALLRGRDLGMDFAGREGWNMYHGDVVPGFPQHPHRGFETVTLVEEGLVDHTDSAGAVARYGAGDAQWLTAGSGVAHAEMFPLTRADGPNPLHLFQIWLNLPLATKDAPADFSMFWADQLPIVETSDAAGRLSRVKLVAGRFGEATPPAPPTASWAARPESDLAIWHATLDPDAVLTLPVSAGPDTIRVLYPYEGTLTVDGETLAGRGAVVDAATPLEVTAGSAGARLLVLQGRPIGEPVYQQGPFVAASKDGLRAAFADYNAGRFGRWPHASDAPVQPHGTGRFARYPDGRVTAPAS